MQTVSSIPATWPPHRVEGPVNGGISKHLIHTAMGFLEIKTTSAETQMMIQLSEFGATQWTLEKDGRAVLLIGQCVWITEQGQDYFNQKLIQSYCKE